jgi:hypothetical protein
MHTIIRERKRCSKKLSKFLEIIAIITQVLTPCNSLEINQITKAQHTSNMLCDSKTWALKKRQMENRSSRDDIVEKN